MFTQGRASGPKYMCTCCLAEKTNIQINIYTVEVLREGRVIAGIYL